jgi:hypothetical protein
MVVGAIVAMLAFASVVYGAPQSGGGGPDESGSGAVGGLESPPYSGPCEFEELDIDYILDDLIPSKGGSHLIEHHVTPAVVSYFKAKFDPYDTMRGEPMLLTIIQMKNLPQVTWLIFFDVQGCDVGSTAVPSTHISTLLWQAGVEGPKDAQRD